VRSDQRATETVTLAPIDNRALANLCGPLDANLRQIEAALDVTIGRRGAQFTIAGARSQVAQGADAIRRFYDEAAKPLSVDDIQLGLVEIAALASNLAHPGERDARDVAEQQAADEPADGVKPLLRTRRADLHGRTPNQVAYLEAIQAHDISFGIGPAGTGKTYLAVACAVDAL